MKHSSSDVPQTPVRVAMVGSFPPQAQGIQDYCRELAEGIGQHTTIHAIGFRRMYPRRLFPGVKDAMDPTKSPPRAPHLTCEHRMTWYNPFGWLLRALTVPADVVHLQWWSLPLWPIMMTFALAARLRRLPLVVTVHNVLPHESSRYFVPASKTVCRLAHCVVVHSQTNADQLRQHYGLPGERIVVVPMPVTRADVVPIEKYVARRSLHIKASPPTILLFGTIRPYKGLGTLLEAVARLRDRLPDAQLIIAGKPWEPWQPYEEKIHRLGLMDNVFTFIDYVPEDEVNTLLSAADCFVLPYTHFDAQSAVGALYLPYGKPMVVTNVGGLPHWVNQDTRFVVPPDSPDALADALIDLFANLPERNAWFESWAKEALLTMTPRAVGARHLEIYGTLLTASPND